MMLGIQWRHEWHECQDQNQEPGGMLSDTRELGVQSVQAVRTVSVLPVVPSAITTVQHICGTSLPEMTAPCSVYKYKYLYDHTLVPVPVLLWRPEC